MSATIELSSIFSRYTDNNLSIPVEGKTLKECIDELAKKYPDMKRLILDKEGRLVHSYDIYVNGESSYPLEMSKKVQDGDKINLVFIIQGG
jgi:molybdopterin converting factor small subunit